jgi:uncharacterized radical SAM protein YgiQ
MQNTFLPTTKKEMLARDWDQADVILVTGDAYIDHPSFGTAVIGRLMEKEGFRVAILAQPNWQDDLRDFKKFGKPKYFFGVTSGAMDSMVNHYTASKRRRSDDAYTAGGKSGFRPDYATSAYSKILKKLFPETAVVLGGIEASLRRFTHYDYWKDSLRPSILEESEADLLIYGMGEKPLLEILKLLKKNVPFSSLKTVPQTAILQKKEENLPKNKKWENFELFSHETCLSDKIKFAKNFKTIEQESNSYLAKRLIQNIGNKRLVVNPPYPPMTSKEIDKSFDLPYLREVHPKYKKRGKVPAFEMIKFSVNMHRGCFGGCSFCTISAHQGKFVSSRSEASILKEIDEITKKEDFRGMISDLGGPSANMYKMEGYDLEICKKCKRPSCIFPSICKNLNVDHSSMTSLYQKVLKNDKIKKAFVSSGIRYDMLVDEKAHESANKYIEQLVNHHVSGRLKIAPEHSSKKVLDLMRKPSFSLFYKFKEKFEFFNQKSGKKQFLIPYFISSHPNSDEEAMAELAAETKDLGFKLEQVQDFTPTPMTLATVIYYSGYDPYKNKFVRTAKTKDEKKAQNIFFFWYKKQFQSKIFSILKKIGREDLTEKLGNK